MKTSTIAVLINEFKTIDVPFKSWFFGTFLMMPFWYLDIHLLAKWYIRENAFYLPLIISFCVSVGWIMVGIFFFSGVEGKSIRVRKKKKMKQIFAFCLAVLGLASLIAFKIKATFHELVLWAFIIMVCGALQGKAISGITKWRKRRAARTASN